MSPCRSPVAAQKKEKAESSQSAGAARPGNAGLAFQNLLVRVVKNVSPSVIQIETNAGLGSGVVYDGNGNGKVVTRGPRARLR